MITESFTSHIPPLTGALEALNIIPHGRKKKKTVNENRRKPTSINGENGFERNERYHKFINENL